MGVYTVTKEFTKKIQGGRQIVRVGSYIQIPGRIEAQQRLDDGEVVKGKVRLPKAKTKTVPSLEDSWAPIVNRLRLELGWPRGACLGRLRRMVAHDGMTITEAGHRLLVTQGAGTRKERLDLLAEDLGMKVVNVEEHIQALQLALGITFAGACQRFTEDQPSNRKTQAPKPGDRITVMFKPKTKTVKKGDEEVEVEVPNLKPGVLLKDRVGQKEGHLRVQLDGVTEEMQVPEETVRGIA